MCAPVALFAIFLCCVLGGLKAQRQLVVIPRFVNFGVEDGLSQSTITDIYQDKRGYLWFGTPDGLNRYDGENIETLKPAPLQTNKPVSNYVRGHISEDAKGQIWYANETGVFRCNPATLKVEVFGFPEGQPAPAGTSGIYYDLNSKVYWLFAPKIGLLSYDVAANKFEYYKIPNLDPSCITGGQNVEVDNLRQIWVPVENSTGIYAFNTRIKTYKHYLPKRQVYAVYAQAGRYFFHTTDGILSSYTLDQIKYAFGEALPARLVTKICGILEDPYKRIWISTIDEGLWCYSPQSGNLLQYVRDNKLKSSLPSDHLTDLTLDHTANLWVGTKGRGLSKIDIKPPRFNGFPKEEGLYPTLQDFSIKSLYESSSESVWFGAANGGVYRFDPQQDALQVVSPQRQGLLVSAFFKDKHGTLWAGHNNGIAAIDEKSHKIVPVVQMPEPFKNGTLVNSIMETADGRLVAATALGLASISKTNGNKLAMHLPAQAQPYSDVVELSNGTIWASSPIDGLHRFESVPERGWVLKERYLEQTPINDLHVSEKDGALLWLATNTGLIVFNTQTKQINLYGDDEGLNSRMVYGILEDRDHQLWISTNRGLSKINPNIEGAYFANYSIGDGLQNAEFNPRAFYKSPGGTFYFGGIHGFNWFTSPLWKDTFSFKPRVDIDKIFVNGQMPGSESIYVSKLYLDLPYDNNDLTFKFATLDFSRPSMNKVQYRLEGKDETYITQKEKTVHFVNLEPGNYKLHVMAGNAFGDWSAERTLDIRIQTSFWKYIGIDLLLLLICLLLAFGLYFRQQQQYKRLLEKQNAIEKDRIRIAKDMHDEIGSGLTRIAHMTDLIDPAKIKDKKASGYLEEIGRSSRKLVLNIGEIIWAMNPQQDTLDSLLAYLREQSYQFFEPFESVNYQIYFPDQIPHLELSNQQRRNLFYTAKESLNNALKHADASQIELFFVLQGQTLCFEVRDNGKGLLLTEKKQQTGGFGLPNLRRRMQEIGGTIDWNSEPGKGTSVVFALPLPNQPRSVLQSILDFKFPGK